MLQYIISFGISLVVFLAIQYYFNNYSSQENNHFFNNGYNKYYIFIALFVLINAIMHFYFNDKFDSILSSSSESSVKPDTNLKSFEDSFINTIKDQEVEVGLAPF